MTKLNIEVINSFDRTQETIIGYSPYFGSYGVEIRTEEGVFRRQIIYSESHNLCLKTPENLASLDRLKEIDRQVKELQEEGYAIVKSMGDVVSPDWFKEFLVANKQ